MNQYLVKISVDEARPYAELKIHAENLVDCGEQLLHLGLKRADIDGIYKKDIVSGEKRFNEILNVFVNSAVVEFKNKSVYVPFDGGFSSKSMLTLEVVVETLNGLLDYDWVKQLRS